MLEILLTKGIPASGKSTFAKKLAEQGSHTRVNKDDLRAMLHASVFTEANEKFVLSTRDFIVEECLRKDLSVVVDDTNFDGQHFKRMCLIAEKYGTSIHVIFNIIRGRSYIKGCDKMLLEKTMVVKCVRSDRHISFIKNNVKNQWKNESIRANMIENSKNTKRRKRALRNQHTVN